MKPNPIREIPPHYREAQQVALTQGRLLLMLNLMSLVLLALAVLLMSYWWTFVTRLRPFIPGEDIALPWWLGLLLALVIVLPLHELLHGLVIAWVGHRPRYGIKWSSGVLYATADNALFRRDEYIAVALAPLVVITLLGMGLLFVAPGWAVYHIAIGVVINAGGAIADVWSVGLLLRYPQSAIVRDEADGFRVFVP